MVFKGLYTIWVAFYCLNKRTEIEILCILSGHKSTILKHFYSNKSEISFGQKKVKWILKIGKIIRKFKKKPTVLCY